ncbi:hypothetical protein E2C01_011051 [Portunus trituberculatus]|uniref:Uncharacterized protein n=1 Tax=Portunus trituberculatus TaxID=210409 RepID=A0A5B7DAH2_PORTR|nr:hypothetical protein [Portunus trituberculatus]
MLGDDRSRGIPVMSPPSAAFIFVSDYSEYQSLNPPMHCLIVTREGYSVPGWDDFRIQSTDSWSYETYNL